MEAGKKISAMEILRKMSKIHDITKKSHLKYVSKHNLTLPQFHVLEALIKYGSMPLKKIGDLLSVTGANITCVVDNLEKDQLVKRVHSIQDRRIVFAEITDKGKDLIERILPDYESNINDLMKGLSDEDKDRLVNLLDKLCVNGGS